MMIPGEIVDQSPKRKIVVAPDAYYSLVFPLQSYEMTWSANEYVWWESCSGRYLAENPLTESIVATIPLDHLQRLLSFSEQFDDQ